MPDRILIELSRWDPRGLLRAVRRWWGGLGTATQCELTICIVAVATLAIAAGSILAG